MVVEELVEKKTRRRGSDRRRLLLESALDLFSTRGIDGATTRAIAENAGVSEAILFRHFESKQALLRAVVAELGPRTLFPAPPPSWETLPLEDSLRARLTLYLDSYWANRACLRMMFMATERDRAIFDEVRAQFGEQALALFGLMTRHANRGEMAVADAGPGTEILSASLSGFLLHVSADEPDDWETTRAAFVEKLLKIVLNGLRAPSPSESR